MTRIVLVAILCCATAAWAQPAPPPAAPSAALTAEFQAGVDAFRLGQYDEAVKRLTLATQLEPTLPGPHRFLAAVAAAQQRWSDCITSARMAIQLNPQSAEITATRKLHDDCREADGRPAFLGSYDGGGGAIAVNANVSGATVTVGGLKYGATPLAPRALAVGEVTVSAAKGGWKTAEVTTTILPGVVTDVTLELVEEAPVVGGGGDNVTPQEELGWLRIEAPAGAVITIDGVAMKPDERGRYALAPKVVEVYVDAPGKVPERRQVRVAKGQEVRETFTLESRGARDRRRSTGRIAMVAAVGLGAVGAMTGLKSIRATDEARDAWTLEVTRPTTIPLSESTAIAPLRTRDEIQTLADRGKRWALVSNISYGAAAVAAGVGIYFLARAGDDEEAPRATIAPVVGDTWGVAVSGRLP